MKQSLIKSFFFFFFQALAVQVLGVTFFLVISFYLPKDDFGIISWANAVSMMLTTILSFGLEQVVTRRIAASDRSDWAAAAFLFHAFIGSLLALGVILVLSFFFSGSRSGYTYLPLFFAAQAFIYIASPLKQFLNAKHRFGPYGVIAVCSNLLKIILAFVFIYYKQISIGKVTLILIICAVLELLALLYYVTSRSKFHFRFKLTAYLKLLKEALPQYISVLFDSSLSRMDWILLGILATDAITAEYSFAYRAFELSRLPMAIVAPLLLNIFAKMLTQSAVPDEEKKQGILSLFRIEMFGSVLLVLMLNIIWTPAVEYLFKGKYGHVNYWQFMILSLCIPVQFFTNLLWTICFTSKKYRPITTITATTAVVNILLNIIFIPYWGGLAAAISFLITAVLQMLLYYFVVRKLTISFPVVRIGSLFLIACLAYLVATRIVENVFLQILVAVSTYLVITILTRQVHKGHVHDFKKYIRK